MPLMPAMRTDEHFVQKHKSILEFRNKEAVQTIFLGDSLTRRWEDNSHLWEFYFSDFKPANLGVGADCIENLLWRIENGEIDNFEPKLILLLIGTNNLAKDGEETIIEGILETARLIRRKCTEARLVVFGLLPREKDENGNDCMARIKKINRELNAKSALNNYQYEYFGDKLLRNNGMIDKAIMPDGLHLNEAGYKLAGPLIQEIIRKHL
ncbi:MAG TPA: GDSL-type esterase/lipase family protein [Anaerolineales bacterium]|nr:GDSL-type esterase/lipase family protein [Anaerolineales bacterium]